MSLWYFIPLKWLALCSNIKGTESFVDNIFELMIKLVSSVCKKKSLEAGISHTGEKLNTTVTEESSSNWKN